MVDFGGNVICYRSMDRVSRQLVRLVHERRLGGSHFQDARNSRHLIIK